MKQKFTNLSPQIYKVLKQVHPDLGISNNAMHIIEDILGRVFQQIMEEAYKLSEINRRKTIGSREIQTSVRLVFPGELAKHGVSEGTKAVVKYLTSRRDKGRRTKSAAAGITFSVAKIHSKMKEAIKGKRLGESAPIYLAAVLEYLCAEVLDLAGRAAAENKRGRIIPRYIFLSISYDAELNKLIMQDQRGMILFGGISPEIMPRCMRLQFQKSGTQDKNEEDDLLPL
eukprot:TRINITY_DN4888_c0_g1_i1.p1 TRINITY_DN4888_c0_g1~~TRINITY_DN4888_c0_g1_i1.p1  ORF type:complete len:228 (-),score=35.01 TRINITY_DN4888_c0_g1_i1:109-792(-)